jgi:hypothetical protein
MESFDKFYESVVEEASKRPEWNKPDSSSKATKADPKTKIENWASGHIEDLSYWYEGKKGAATKQNALENKAYRNLAKWVNKTDFIQFASIPTPHKVYGGYSGGDRNTNFDDKATIFKYIVDGIPQYRTYGKLDGVALLYYGHKPDDLSKYIKNGISMGVTEAYPRGRPQLRVSIDDRELSGWAEELIKAYPILVYNRHVTKVMDDWDLKKLREKINKENTEKKATHVPKKRIPSKGPSAAWLRRNT